MALVSLSISLWLGGRKFIHQVLTIFFIEATMIRICIIGRIFLSHFSISQDKEEIDKADNDSDDCHDKAHGMKVVDCG